MGSTRAGPDRHRPDRRGSGVGRRIGGSGGDRAGDVGRRSGRCRPIGRSVARPLVGVVVGGIGCRDRRGGAGDDRRRSRAGCSGSDRGVRRAERAPRAWWAVRSNHPPRDVGVTAALGGSGRSSAVLTWGACTIGGHDDGHGDRLRDQPGRLRVDTRRLRLGLGRRRRDGVGLRRPGRRRRSVPTSTIVTTSRPGGPQPSTAEPWWMGRPCPPSSVGESSPTSPRRRSTGDSQAAPDEIALGRLTADELGLEVGDTTTVTSELLGETREVEVVGVVDHGPVRPVRRRSGGARRGGVHRGRRVRR